MAAERVHTVDPATGLIHFPVRVATAGALPDRRARPFPEWWRVPLFALLFLPAAYLALDGGPSEAHRALIDRASSGTPGLGDAPLALLLAWLWPVNAWLVAVGALAAAWTLRSIARGFVDRGFARPLRWLLLAALVSSPGLQRLVAGDVTSVLFLALALVALAGLLNFVERRSTADGFFAGIALGAAALVAPASLWLGALAGGWAFARVALQRPSDGARPDRIAAAASAATVVVFPAVAALLAVACLGWASGAGFGFDLRPATEASPPIPDVAAVGAALLRSPLFLLGVVVALIRLRQEPTGAVVHAVPALLLLFAVAIEAPLSPHLAAPFLLGTALLFLRPAGVFRQLDLALVAVVQLALNAAEAAGQL
jgi:hypothetical protein